MNGDKAGLRCSCKAPGDAEAELAYLGQEGYIDAVVSEDSDTLVFRAPVIIRM
jgi:holliday junction resolvase YEN1